MYCPPDGVGCPEDFSVYLAWRYNKCEIIMRRLETVKSANLSAEANLHATSSRNINEQVID